MPLRKAKLIWVSPRPNCNCNRKLVVGKFAVYYIEISSEKNGKIHRKNEAREKPGKRKREFEGLKTVNRKRSGCARIMQSTLTWFKLVFTRLFMKNQKFIFFENRATSQLVLFSSNLLLMSKWNVHQGSSQIFAEKTTSSFTLREKHYNSSSKLLCVSL